MPLAAETKKLTKRERTRRKLLTATRDLIYEKGIEQVAILDITTAAGLAAGSFYNYFDNKPAIVQAIIEDFQAVFESHLAETRKALKDPAMRISVTLKYYFEQAQSNEAWRSFIINAGLSDEQIIVQSRRQCTEDILAGQRGGRFKTENAAITQSLITGMATHVGLEIQGDTCPVLQLWKRSAMCSGCWDSRILLPKLSQRRLYPKLLDLGGPIYLKTPAFLFGLQWIVGECKKHLIQRCRQPLSFQSLTHWSAANQRQPACLC